MVTVGASGGRSSSVPVFWEWCATAPCQVPPLTRPPVGVPKKTVPSGRLHHLQTAPLAHGQLLSAGCIGAWASGVLFFVAVFHFFIMVFDILIAAGSCLLSWALCTWAYRRSVKRRGRKPGKFPGGRSSRRPRRPRRR